MRQVSSKYRGFTIVVLLLLALAMSACRQAAEPAAAVESIAETSVPAEIVEAREAVLNFLREGANECVPPAIAEWRVEDGRAPDGYAVYRFHSGTCLMTVAFPLAAEETTYHVGVHDGHGGFCWQAIVDDRGRVIGTGPEGVLLPPLAEAAATYCEEQGYTHTVEEQPDGSTCGVCTFPDGSQCKAWLYYQGECGPAGEDSLP